MTSLHVICGLGPPNQKFWLRLCCRVYGWCHHYYAVYLIKANRSIEAMQMFKDALKIYKQASDRHTEKEKMDFRILTSQGLHDVTDKLQQQDFRILLQPLLIRSKVDCGALVAN